MRVTLPSNLTSGSEKCESGFHASKCRGTPVRIIFHGDAVSLLAKTVQFVPSLEKTIRQLARQARGLFCLPGSQ